MTDRSPNPELTESADLSHRRAPSSPGERFAPGALLAGRYRIVAQLGKGGMGEVYRADDLTLGQPVALKFLPRDLASDSERLVRFHKEVAAARRVSHPHVCRTYDIGQHAGQSFLTMEFVDGEDLSSVLKRLGRVPEEKGIEIARQLCSALATVHEQGLLHRDLKPANVMLDGRGKVRLTDFGLALAVEDLSLSDARSGTPLYQSPEQLAGQQVTVRSDLYALGLVLYELFTGKRPFVGIQRDSTPSKPSSHVSNLHPAVEQVILRCLESDPAIRPRSASEVAAHLPGGDPLAAALAAGETPSPQMVADAAAEGTLRPAVAIAMFAGIATLLLLIAALNDRFKAHRHIPVPAPAVMEDKARAMVRELGYAEPPADTFGRFEMPAEHQSYMARHNSQPAVPKEQWHLCRPALAVYWHRHSPLPLIPKQEVRMRVERISSDNPPDVHPGMITLRIDTLGRLVGFQAVPDPKIDSAVGPVDWDAVLKLAGLDQAGALQPDNTLRPTPTVFADETKVWTGVYPEVPDLAIRVEAGAYRNRLVFFRITHPDWGDPLPDRPNHISNRTSSYLYLLQSIFGLLVFGLFAVAIWNVGQGRADVRGALVVAAICCTGQTLFDLLAGIHLPHWGVVVELAMSEFALQLFVAAMAIASYLALEPAIRRQCPHRLTAWTRLAYGRWFDPLIGRDVLIGLLVGLVCMLDWPSLPFWPSPWGPSVVRAYSFTDPVGTLAGMLGNAIANTWLFAGVFAVVLTITRRDWIGAAFILAFLVLTVGATGLPLVHQVVMVLRHAVLLGLLLRLGILAASAGVLAVQTVDSSPLTLDSSAWYFSASLTYTAALLALAAYAAWVSLGRQGDSQPRLAREG